MWIEYEATRVKRLRQHVPQGVSLDEWRLSGDGQRSAIEAIGEEQAAGARIGETVLRQRFQRFID